jgi:hypothetical protein
MSQENVKSCDYWNCEKPRATNHCPGIRYCIIHEELGA